MRSQNIRGKKISLEVRTNFQLSKFLKPIFFNFDFDFFFSKIKEGKLKREEMGLSILGNSFNL